MAIAYFYTWTTYGTWLPGDERGWLKHFQGNRSSNKLIEFEAQLLMSESAITLNPSQRELVEKTIREHCAIRNWILHAVNCRTNHAHVVVTANERKLPEPRIQFKAWCTRRLKENERDANAKDPLRECWWTERGWDEYIDTDNELADVVAYVLEGQTIPRS